MYSGPTMFTTPGGAVRVLKACFVVWVLSLAIGGPSVLQAQSRGTKVALVDSAALRAWDATIERMVTEGDLRIRRADVDPLAATRTHERLAQYYKGVAVHGAELTRQIDASTGATISLFGTVYTDIDLNVTPT